MTPPRTDPSRPAVAVVHRRVPEGGVAGWPTTAAAAAPASVIEALHRSDALPVTLLQPASLHVPSPVAAPAVAASALARRALSGLNGLLLIGGPDVAPERYGARAHRTVYGVDTTRDAYERALCLTAIEQRLPLLAICRGMQVLNVALGGSLLQNLADLPDRHIHGTPGEGRPVLHPVAVQPGTRLAAAMPGGHPVCSSYHHQALDLVAPALVVSAVADDTTVEAVELRDPGAWVLGVQWHPEDTARHDAQQQGLFDAFVSQARVGAVPAAADLVS